MNAPQGSGAWLNQRVQHIPISPAGKTIEGRSAWKFLCGRCGKTFVWARDRVESGAKKDCGCGKTARHSAASRKHGMRDSKEYRAWHAIKNRCLNPRTKDFQRYGGAGIGMFHEWVNDFPAFFAHVGEAPSAEHQIDRIDTTRGYEPGNVRWATRSEQQRNRRTTYVWHIKGCTYQTSTEAAEANRVTVQTICKWVLGYRDARRGTYTPPRNDCKREARYE